VDYVLVYWTNNVKPAQLCISHQFFDLMAKAKPLMKKPHLRLMMTLAMYEPSAVIAKAPPHPSIGNLFSSADVISMDKVPVAVELAETNQRNNKDMGAPAGATPGIAYVADTGCGHRHVDRAVPYG
jgi:hypothetical protein